MPVEEGGDPVKMFWKVKYRSGAGGSPRPETVGVLQERLDLRGEQDTGADLMV